MKKISIRVTVFGIIILLLLPMRLSYSEKEVYKIKEEIQEIQDKLVSTGVNISSDKKVYGQDETIRIKVINYLDEEVCFESCPPSFFEKMTWDGRWEKFGIECESSWITDCIQPNEIKTINFTRKDFEVFFKVPSFPLKGTYRIPVHVSYKCEHKQDKEYGEYISCQHGVTVYSNEFKIK